jgi:hypothetical protein
MAKKRVSEHGLECSIATGRLCLNRLNSRDGTVRLTGQVPPLMILSKDRASGMPYGQLELDVTESLAELFSDWKEAREDAT